MRPLDGDVFLDGEITSMRFNERPRDSAFGHSTAPYLFELSFLQHSLCSAVLTLLYLMAGHAIEAFPASRPPRM